MPLSNEIGRIVLNQGIHRMQFCDPLGQDSVLDVVIET